MGTQFCDGRCCLTVGRIDRSWCVHSSRISQRPNANWD